MVTEINVHYSEILGNLFAAIVTRMYKTVIVFGKNTRTLRFGFQIIYQQQLACVPIVFSFKMTLV